VREQAQHAIEVKRIEDSGKEVKIIKQSENEKQNNNRSAKNYANILLSTRSSSLPTLFTS
jgi:hypothetical protein